MNKDYKDKESKSHRLVKKPDMITSDLQRKKKRNNNADIRKKLQGKTYF